MSDQCIRRNIVLAILLGALPLPVACTHIVRRPIKCGPQQQPIGRSVVGWQRVAGSPGVSGKVLSPGSLVPIPSAAVGLTLLQDLPQATAKPVGAYTDVGGAFRIDSTPPGRYLMIIRRIGYHAAHDTLVIAPDSAIIATGLLVPDYVVLDGCGLMYEEVRVPWWKR